jgi:hypothetical protein
MFPATIPTLEAVDVTLASLTDEDLIALALSDQSPRVEWTRMTAQQRRVLRASNMLTKRAAAAERREQDAATQAANKDERELIARKQRQQK